MCSSDLTIVVTAEIGVFVLFVLGGKNRDRRLPSSSSEVPPEDAFTKLRPRNEVSIFSFPLFVQRQLTGFCLVALLLLPRSPAWSAVTILAHASAAHLSRFATLTS